MVNYILLDSAMIQALVKISLRPLVRVLPCFIGKAD